MSTDKEEKSFQTLLAAAGVGSLSFLSSLIRSATDATDAAFGPSARRLLTYPRPAC